jgi:hypothetical protein
MDSEGPAATLIFLYINLSPDSHLRYPDIPQNIYQHSLGPFPSPKLTFCKLTRLQHPILNYVQRHLQLLGLPPRLDPQFRLPILQRPSNPAGGLALLFLSMGSDKGALLRLSFRDEVLAVPRSHQCPDSLHFYSGVQVLQAASGSVGGTPLAKT